MTNMETVLQGLISYHQQMEESGQFSPQELMRKMEPIYNAVNEQHSSPRILILFGGGAGDFVLLSPCLREIRRLYEQAGIFLVVSPNVAQLAIQCPYVDKVVAFDYLHLMGMENELFYIECVAFVQKYFSYTFDIAFNFSSFFTGSLLAYMSGARERFLFLSAAEWGLFHKQIPYAAAQALSTVLYPEKKRSPHMVDSYLAVLDNLLHFPVANRELEIWFTADDIAYVRSFLPDVTDSVFIAIGLGGQGNGHKSWPVENYLQLMLRIQAHDKYVHFLITGGLAEKESAAFLAEHFAPDKYTNLAGALTFPQTAALLSLCHYYIGNDTGTMHIAAANHIPILVVFAYAANLPYSEFSNLERYAPYHVPSVIIQPDNALPECMQYLGHPLQVKLGCVANRPHCIKQVSVAEMYNGYLALRGI